MTEPGAGSDLAGMKTRAEERGDHWVLNGSKTYISNGQIGDLIIVAARTVPDKTHGLGLFLVEGDMPGFKRGRNLEEARSEGAGHLRAVLRQRESAEGERARRSDARRSTT